MRREQELIQDMERILKGKMEKDYEVGKTKRDAHPKSLGLLKGKFFVEENLPAELQEGVFQAGASYDTLIRVSNASGKVVSDKKKDFRGFAMKLIGVEGERFSNEESHTQDFLLMTHPTMPLGTVKLFHDAVYYSIERSPLLLLLKFLFTGKGYILKEVAKGKKNDTSPLDIRYWSTTPYQFGDRQVKYFLQPTSKRTSTLPKPLTDDYLTKNMANHLAEEEASFDFFVQFFEDEKTTPIEDAGVEWKTPMRKVGRLVLPKQVIETEERTELAEQLSFSPANALLVHKPIGGINRARNEIYKNLSAFRHKRDSKVLIEPTKELVDKI